jgi:hypothetical protein
MVLPGVWPLNSHELNRDSSNRGWGQRARTPRAVQPGLPIVSMVQVRTLLLYQNAVVLSEYPARPESAVHALLPSGCCGPGPLRVPSPRCKHGAQEACHWRPVSGSPMALCGSGRLRPASASLVTLSGRILVLVPCHSARRCAHRHPRRAVAAHFYSSPCSYSLQHSESSGRAGSPAAAY